MAFDSNIYFVDWKKLIRLLLPVRMRNFVLLNLLYAIIQPIIGLYSDFLQFKKGIQYQLGLNGQIPFLEKAINDRWDYSQRRLFILDAIEYAALPCYLRLENKPIVLSTKVENLPKVLYTKQETAIYTVDFIVMVPSTVSFNLAEMKSFIDSYKLLSKTYQIKVY